MLKVQIAIILLFYAINGYCQDSSKGELNSFPPKSFSLNTNIPTWLLGIPSVGISYKTNDRFEVLVETTYSPWKYSRADNPRYWKSWSLSPQMRTYVNADRSAYLGAQFSVGQYNISSQQGKYAGGGLTVGKQYYAGKKLLIDLGLTLGYLRLSDRASYTYYNSVFYTNRVKEDSNYWGPTSVSIKLSRKMN